MSPRGIRYSFEGKVLTVREIREQYLPAYSTGFIHACLRAGAASRKEVLARDATADARRIAGAKRGRENSAKRRSQRHEKGIYEW